MTLPPGVTDSDTIEDASREELSEIFFAILEYWWRDKPELSGSNFEPITEELRQRFKIGNVDDIRELVRTTIAQYIKRMKEEMANG